MQHINDPRQTSLYDPFARVFSPLAHKRVQEGWQGVFRHCILALLPVETLAKEFHETLGRPAKELYSMAGLMFMMEFRNGTAEEAAEAYRFDAGVQYALNLEPALQSMASRTVERHLKVFREEDVAALVMERVTAALVRELELNVSKQRLDSTHVFGNMAAFGRARTYMDAQHCAQCPLQEQCPVQGKGAPGAVSSTPPRNGAARNAIKTNKKPDSKKPTPNAPASKGPLAG